MALLQQISLRICQPSQQRFFFFSGSGPIWDHMLPLVVIFLYFLSTWNRSSVFPYLSWPWQCLKGSDFSLGFFSVSLFLHSGHTFWQEAHRNEAGLFSVHLIGGSWYVHPSTTVMDPPSFIWSRLCLPDFSTVNSPFSPLWLIGILWGDIPRLEVYSSSNLSPAFKSVDTCINNPSDGCQTVIDDFHHSFYICLLTFYGKEELCLLIYLSVYLSIYEFIATLPTTFVTSELFLSFPGPYLYICSPTVKHLAPVILSIFPSPFTPSPIPKLPRMPALDRRWQKL